MSDLIEALQIFRKYEDSEFPIHCEEGILYVNIAPRIVSLKDLIQLNELGFSHNGEEFSSDVFDSCG